MYVKKFIDFDKLNSDLDLYKLDLNEYYEFSYDPLNKNKNYGMYYTVHLKGGGIRSNKCQYPAILINFDKSVKYTYLSDCDIEKQDSLISKESIYLPINAGFVPCNVEK